MTDARPGKTRKILKITALSVLGAIIAYQLTAFIWNRAGSNEWQLASEQDGIRIWTLKSPGDSIVKVKAQMRTKARLASILAILEETEVLDKSIGIDKVDVLERKDTPSLYMAYHHYVHNLPQPIGTREFIIQTHHSQDPETHRVEVNVLAAPNKLPPRANLVRIHHLNNIWTLEPRPQGEVELTMFVDLDLGGNLPFFVKNAITPRAIDGLFKSIRTLSTQERYLHATVPHITEPGEIAGTTVSYVEPRGN